MRTLKQSRETIAALETDLIAARETIADQNGRYTTLEMRLAESQRETERAVDMMHERLARLQAENARLREQLSGRRDTSSAARSSRTTSSKPMRCIRCEVNIAADDEHESGPEDCGC
jgi:predicted nuclease with TOPRIM domain